MLRRKARNAFYRRPLLPSHCWSEANDEEIDTEAIEAELTKVRRSFLAEGAVLDVDRDSSERRLQRRSALGLSALLTAFHNHRRSDPILDMALLQPFVCKGRLPARLQLPMPRAAASDRVDIDGSIPPELGAPPEVARSRCCSRLCSSASDALVCLREECMFGLGFALCKDCQAFHHAYFVETGKLCNDYSECMHMCSLCLCALDDAPEGGDRHERIAHCCCYICSIRSDEYLQICEACKPKALATRLLRRCEGRSCHYADSFFCESCIPYMKGNGEIGDWSFCSDCGAGYCYPSGCISSGQSLSCCTGDCLMKGKKLCEKCMERRWGRTTMIRCANDWRSERQRRLGAVDCDAYSELCPDCAVPWKRLPPPPPPLPALPPPSAAATSVAASTPPSSSDSSGSMSTSSSSSHFLHQEVTSINDVNDTSDAPAACRRSCEESRGGFLICRCAAADCGEFICGPCCSSGGADAYCDCCHAAFCSQDCLENARAAAADGTAPSGGCCGAFLSDCCSEVAFAFSTRPALKGLRSGTAALISLYPIGWMTEPSTAHPCARNGDVPHHASYSQTDKSRSVVVTTTGESVCENYYQYDASVRGPDKNVFSPLLVAGSQALLTRKWRVQKRNGQVVEMRGSFVPVLGPPRRRHHRGGSGAAPAAAECPQPVAAGAPGAGVAQV